MDGYLSSFSKCVVISSLTHLTVNFWLWYNMVADIFARKGFVDNIPINRLTLIKTCNYREQRKFSEKLLNAESNFLLMFMENKKWFIDELVEDVQLRLDFFVTRFEEVYWFHSQLYEEMKSCGFEIEKMSELFKAHLKVKENLFKCFA